MRLYITDIDVYNISGDLSDLHLHKNIYEGSQLISNAAHSMGLSFSPICKPVSQDNEYSKWTAQNVYNFTWVVALLGAMSYEYRDRFSMAHPMENLIGTAGRLREVQDAYNQTINSRTGAGGGYISLIERGTLPPLPPGEYYQDTYEFLKDTKQDSRRATEQGAWNAITEVHRIEYLWEHCTKAYTYWNTERRGRPVWVEKSILRSKKTWEELSEKPMKSVSNSVASRNKVIKERFPLEVEPELISVIPANAQTVEQQIANTTVVNVGTARVNWHTGPLAEQIQRLNEEAARVRARRAQVVATPPIAFQGGTVTLNG